MLNAKLIYYSISVNLLDSPEERDLQSVDSIKLKIKQKTKP